jgi:hypothetical protein
VQTAAWPRLAFGLPIKELKELYLTMGMSNVQADAAMGDDIATFKKEVASILPDDNVFYDSNGKMMLIPGGTFEGIEPIITERRSRIIRALKQLPLFLGLNDSTTETQATQQKIIHGKRLNSLRSRVLAIVLKVCNLHLRLLGRPTIAKAIVQPIFPSDSLMEANTEATRITNAVAKRDQGWIDQEQAAMEVTGSGAVSDAPEPTEPETGTEPGEEEQTNQQRQSRERQSAQAFLTELRAQERDTMRAEYRQRVRERRLREERKELAEV